MVALAVRVRTSSGLRTSVRSSWRRESLSASRRPTASFETHEFAAAVHEAQHFARLQSIDYK
jgi:hypothetical protein